MLARIPTDVWFAASAAAAVLIFGIAEPVHVFVAGYVVVCLYVGVCALRK